MFVPWSLILSTARRVKPVGHWGGPVLWTSLTLVGVLLLGALILAVVDHYRKRRGNAERLSAGEQLSQFRSLYERGQMSREEFERVRSLLNAQIRKELQIPGLADEPPAATANPNPGVPASPTTPPDDAVRPAPAPEPPPPPAPPADGPETV